MDLQAEFTREGNGRIGFGEVDGLLAVKPDLNARSFGANAVGIPFARGLHALRFGGGVGLREEAITATLIVESAIVAGTEVGLIAYHLVVKGHPLGAELHATINETFGAF